MALSPDGATLVFAAERDGRAHLYLRRLDEFEARPIADTESGRDPFFSPDGEWIGFFGDLQMKRVAVTGGAAIPIASVSAVIRGAAWHDDGTIIFASEADLGLSRVSATGGPVQTLTTPDAAAGETRHHWPQILPGGRAVLFTVFTGEQSDSLISVISLDTGEREVLIRGGTRPFYVPDRGLPGRGHIVYTHGEELLASVFDLSRLEVSGPPRRIAAGVRTGVAGTAQVAVSPDGTLVYVSGSPSEQKVLVWVDRGGVEETLVAEPERFWFPRLSPDGTRLMVTRLIGGNFDVWIYELPDRRWERLTFDPAFDAAGVWSPDGQRVAFRSFRGPSFSLFWKPADGSAPEQRITNARSPQAVDAWTPDGRALIYHEGGDLWIVPVEGDGPPEPLLQAAYRVSSGVPSPDGRWLAYVSEESGIPEVFVAELGGDHLPAGGMRAQISFGGGVEPAWSPDGRELFYRGSESLMVVGVAPGTALKPTTPRALFPDRYERMGGLRNYDVTGDGQRFVMVKALDALTVDIRIVTNALHQ